MSGPERRSGRPGEDAPAVDPAGGRDQVTAFPGDDPDDTGGSSAQRFAAFDEANPGVQVALVALCRQRATARPGQKIRPSRRVGATCAGTSPSRRCGRRTTGN